MKKVMLIFGTRPEAIKMCPLVKELKQRQKMQTIVCVTGQHREMLDQVLNVFKVKPEYDLEIMKEQQTLFDVTVNILNVIKEILEMENPSIVLVHGDTSTTFVVSLACYYMQIPVGHVEAGLRTYDIYAPFPEEFNREAVSLIAKYHFTPTEASKTNLINEGKPEKNIFITGNTVIDALGTTIMEKYHHPIFDWIGEDKLILLTAHRRENIGEPLYNIFSAINKITMDFPNVKVVYPIHMNPKIKEIADSIFYNNTNIRVIKPLQVLDFHNFMSKAYMILTDSGGIQEEAPSLGKPVLVLRNKTERMEGVMAGTLKLVGTKKENIYNEIRYLLENNNEYQRMSHAVNPYGDGNSSKRIADILEKELNECDKDL